MIAVNQALSRSTSTLSREDGVIWTGGARLDGWQNLLTGLGIKERDKRLHTTIAPDIALTEGELNSLYTSGGLAKRIIDLPVYEMLRKGFTIEGDTDNDVQQESKRIGLKMTLQKMLRWGALHGGSLAVMLIDDGGKLEQPLRENNIRTIEGFHVYDRWRVMWDNRNLYVDPTDPKYGQVEIYTVSPINGSPFRVHESRVLVDSGVDVPDIVRSRNNWWGDSELRAPYDRIRSMGSVYAGIEHVVEDFVQAVLTMKNLQHLIASGQEALVTKRLNLIDMSRHVINTVLLDENETYSKHSSTVTGLPDIIDRFVEALSSETGIPVTLLMGKAPAGLNATGDSDIRVWYDKVASKQEEKVTPHQERVTRIIMLQKNGPFKGREIEDWQLVQNPLWQLDDKQMVEMRKTQADADVAYINAGVLTPEEVAISRFGGGSYSLNTTIDEGMHEVVDPADLPAPVPPVDPAAEVPPGPQDNPEDPLSGPAQAIPVKAAPAQPKAKKGATE